MMTMDATDWSAGDVLELTGPDRTTLTNVFLELQTARINRASGLHALNRRAWQVFHEVTGIDCRDIAFVVRVAGGEISIVCMGRRAGCGGAE